MDEHKDELEWPHDVTKVQNNAFLTLYVLTSSIRPMRRF